MNNYFNDFPQYKNRRCVASYSRRTRSRSVVRTVAESAVNVCERIVEAFESSLVCVILKILSLTALLVGFFFLVAAIEAGSISAVRAVFASFGIVAGTAFILRF